MKKLVGNVGIFRSELYLVGIDKSEIYKRDEAGKVVLAPSGEKVLDSYLYKIHLSNGKKTFSMYLGFDMGALVETLPLFNKYEFEFDIDVVSNHDKIFNKLKISGLYINQEGGK